MPPTKDLSDSPDPNFVIFLADRKSVAKYNNTWGKLFEEKDLMNSQKAN